MWTPADEPDSDDEAVFDSSNSVHLGSDNEILSLWMTNGDSLFAAGNELKVNGSVYVWESGSRFSVDGQGSMLRMHEAALFNGGVLELAGGTAVVDKLGGVGVMVIGEGSSLVGSGVLTFTDNPSAVTPVLLNSGSITASSRGATPFSTPPAGTLQINSSGVGGRIDLDGESESGIVNVTRNQTLDINAPLTDAFSGTISLSQNATLDLSTPWSMSLGKINIDNGFVDNTFPLPDVPAGVSYIRGGTLTVSSGSINLLDGDGTLQFDAPLVMNGGLLSNKGHVIFNNNATIARSASLQMAQSGADLTVSAGRAVSIDQSSFDMDGLSAGLTTIAVQAGGSLALNADDYDNDWDGTTGAGVLAAQSNTLELVDTFAFPFTGTVDADSGRVFANGFALGFEPGSSLRLSNGGTYRSTNATTLGGSIHVLGGAASTIQIDGNQSLTFSAGSETTLDGNLWLTSTEARIESGAVFTGSGAMVVSEGSLLRVDASSDVDILVTNQGKFVVSGPYSLGRVGLGDYEQTSTGVLAVEIAGTGLNEHDHLVVDGAAVLGGQLELYFDGVSPAFGSTLNILTASAGVTGAFDVVDFRSLPPGKTFAVSYLPNAVQLSVVAMPFFAADFDHDGDVDQTD